MKANDSSIYQWRAEGHGFQRVDIGVATGLSFHKVVHDEVVVLAFRGAHWKSEQAGQSYLESPDCVVVRDAGQVYSARLEQIDARTGSSCREIHLSPAALPSFDFSSPLIHGPALAAELFRVHELFEHGSCALEAGTALTELLEALAHRSRGTAPEDPRACSKRTRQTIAYLRAHHADRISLTDLANVVDANPYVLLRQFRKETGATPHDYLRAYRIYRAKQLIARGMPFADVAAACGFSDQSHLIRQFKRSLGVSPSQYRPIRRAPRPLDPVDVRNYL